MSGVNLLPWRDWERAQRRRRFLLALLCAGLAGVLLAGGAGWFTDQATARQERRNAFLAERIAELDGRIAQAERLREREALLASRLAEFERLQAERPTLAGILDALPRALVDGLHFTALARKGEVVAARGAAVSARRISTLMRNIEAAEAFAAPVLKQVEERLPPAPYAAGAVNFELAFSLPGHGGGERGPAPVGATAAAS